MEERLITMLYVIHQEYKAILSIIGGKHDEVKTFLKEADNAIEPIVKHYTENK